MNNKISTDELERLIKLLTGAATVPTAETLLNKAEEILSTAERLSNGGGVTNEAGERVIAIYNALVCKHLRGDIAAVDLLSSEDQSRMLGQATEIAATALAGEAAHLHASIEEISKGLHTPGPLSFPKTARS